MENTGVHRPRGQLELRTHNLRQWEEEPLAGLAGRGPATMAALE